MKVSAYVDIEVEVMVTGAWDDKCPIEQIYKQVGDEAVGKIRNLLLNTREISLSGKPKMRMMYTNDKG